MMKVNLNMIMNFYINIDKKVVQDRPMHPQNKRLNIINNPFPQFKKNLIMMGSNFKPMQSIFHNHNNKHNKYNNHWFHV